MSLDFEAIVRLCRIANRYDLQGSLLSLEVINSPEIERLLREASAYRQPEVYVQGQQQHCALSSIPAGAAVELRFDGLVSNNKVFATNLKSLLSYQRGLFLVTAPPEYFLLEENYATGDPTVPDLIRAYQRLPKLFELLRSVADVVIDEGTSSPTFVLLSGKRLDISVSYDVGTLGFMPSGESIDEMLVELGGAPFIDAKKNIFKKVTIRLLDTVPVETRFDTFVRCFETLRDLFAADLELYITEFDFEKVREGFEQKRLTFILQLNNATSDLLTKILAIPIAQGLVVSQFKNEATAVLGNIALFLGSLVFATLAILLIVNQQQSLSQIKQEIRIEEDALQRRFPGLHQRLDRMFDVLKRRAWLHAWMFPIVIGCLLSATTLYSGYAFFKVPPGSKMFETRGPMSVEGDGAGTREFRGAAKPGPVVGKSSVPRVGGPVSH